ncbi:MAG TPA: M20/M25/M40 family metallo-hydrolase [Oligoflexia bacterium]|nr:M20/M25/M40 family metallo-hydrolase [Oligoflexia bacterium]HMP47115.1 M20/M25/M40 family metallo-hydrolase [Oligoflexia bacterium]
MKEVIDYLNGQFDAKKEELLNEFFTFLRFKSISADPEYESEIKACANWIVEYLDDIGFKTQLLEGDKPCIFAERIIDPSFPTILVYNHYDVQPVDPIELWESPPFEPEIRNGEIYARGAEDNKGQCFYVLRALKELSSSKDFPQINLKLLIEGEEETGSKSLPGIFSAHKELFKSDYLFIIDSGFTSMTKPAITLGCRGIVTMTVELQGSSGDLHSGEHGGIVYNPLHGMIELLAKLRNEETGEIKIPGFYDDVAILSDEQKKSYSLALDPEFYRNMFHAEMNGGEKNYSPLESAWLRPTLEINGLSGGYAGPGFKTVIPAKATAKISARLVPDQNPKNIAKLISDYLTEHTPSGLKLEITNVSDGGYPFRSSADSKACLIARKAYEGVLGLPCENILAGGSIPIAADLQMATSAETVLIGYGLPDDQIHAPNEHFGIDRIKKGMATFGAILSLIATEDKS